MISVETDDGVILRCTHYHRFFIKSEDKTYIDMVEAKDLKPDDILMDYELPIINRCIKKFEKYYNNSHTTITNGYVYIFVDSIDILCEYKCLLQGCGVNATIIRDKNIRNKNISKDPFIELTPEDVHILHENGFAPNEWTNNPHIFSNNMNIPIIKTNKKRNKKLKVLLILKEQMILIVLLNRNVILVFLMEC